MHGSHPSSNLESTSIFHGHSVAADTSTRPHISVKHSSTGVGVVQDLPQQGRALGGHHCVGADRGRSRWESRNRRWRGSQVQGQLVRGNAVPADLHQSSQLGLSVGRSQVLDDLVPAPFLDRDLHRRRPRGCLDLTQKRAHLPHSTGPLVCQHTHNYHGIPTKTRLKTQNPPKCHKLG